MIRKLVMLAITSGLAKKAWNAYQQKNAMAAGGTPAGRSRTGMGASNSSPASRAASSDGRPDAS